MADKLMYIPNVNTQNYPFCRLQLVVESGASKLFYLGGGKIFVRGGNSIFFTPPKIFTPGVKFAWGG